MNVHLLYAQKEWKGIRPYYDSESIINDLGLTVLFQTATRNQEEEEEAMPAAVQRADRHLEEVLKKVMLAPLSTPEEIYFRQAVLMDFIEDKEFTKKLYELSRDMMTRWERLGKNEVNKPGAARERGIQLVSRVKVLHLFVNVLAQIKDLCRAHRGYFQSEGLQRFADGLLEDFSDEWEGKLKKALADIAFFSDGEEEYSLEGSGSNKVRQTRMVLGFQVENGLKLGSFWLDSLETINKKFRKSGEKVTFSEKMKVAFASEPTMILKSSDVLEDLMRLENRVVEYVMGCFEPFMKQCRDFFEQLYFESAFYRACYNLYVRSCRTGLSLCYPRVCEKDCLFFENLTEFSMATYRGRIPVGNDGDIRNKMLLIVTGANQGGKSTFLRSLGIAQVMMQCGMFVSAKQFESGIFPHFFPHFTRREDSAMNSGRLDEELGRFDRIIAHLGKDSLVLLNESFATTTEEEGSDIAYDIIRALTEAGVKVLTVTHLLSFARRIYEEKRPEAEFLCAERKADGRRTYKMVKSAPELTSFGLDLYDQIIPAHSRE